MRLKVARTVIISEKTGTPIKVALTVFPFCEEGGSILIFSCPFFRLISVKYINVKKRELNNVEKTLIQSFSTHNFAFFLN